MKTQQTLWTIWQFRTPNDMNPFVIAHLAEPNDFSVQHEYQKVLGQVMANSSVEAFQVFINSKNSKGVES